MVKSEIILPTFYILGAQKAGTTWLHSVLKGHPEIGFGKRKEIHFFDYLPKFNMGVDWYSEQFSHNTGRRAYVDSTPKYLRMVLPETCANDDQIPKNAIENLKALTPDAKFIVLLRNPVKRALSAYFMHLKLRNIRLSQNIMKPPKTTDLLVAGHYADQLEIWFKHFPRSNFLIFFYEEDIEPDEAKLDTVQKTCEFVDVNSAYIPSNLFEIRNERLPDFDLRMRNYFGKWAKYSKKVPQRIRTSPVWKIEISAASVQELEEYYKEPNRKLSDLLGRELPW